MNTETTVDPVLEKALTEYNDLLASFQSVQLGTVNGEGLPEVSYSPAVVHEAKSFYVYVSDMSTHTANMLTQKKASLMVIADESNSTQIFARKRATFTCAAAEIERESEHWTKITALFSSKFGNIMDHLKGMTDFHLVELKPSKGRVVLGFGRAFDVAGAALDSLEHVKGSDGKGHTRAEKGHGHGGGHGHGHAAAQPASEGIDSASVERIVSHMNEDHSDSVVLYVKHFAKRTDVTSALLSSIDANAMHIKLASGEEISIPFEKPLTSSHDAHMTLVEMSKTARKSLAGA